MAELGKETRPGRSDEIWELLAMRMRLMLGWIFLTPLLGFVAPAILQVSARYRLPENSALTAIRDTFAEPWTLIVFGIFSALPCTYLMLVMYVMLVRRAAKKGVTSPTFDWRNSIARLISVFFGWVSVLLVIYIWNSVVWATHIIHNPGSLEDNEWIIQRLFWSGLIPLLLGLVFGYVVGLPFSAIQFLRGRRSDRTEHGASP